MCWYCLSGKAGTAPNTHSSRTGRHQDVTQQSGRGSLTLTRKQRRLGSEERHNTLKGLLSARNTSGLTRKHARGTRSISHIPGPQCRPALNAAAWRGRPSGGTRRRAGSRRETGRQGCSECSGPEAAQRPIRSAAAQQHRTERGVPAIPRAQPVAGLGLRMRVAARALLAFSRTAKCVQHRVTSARTRLLCDTSARAHGPVWHVTRPRLPVWHQRGPTVPAPCDTPARLRPSAALPCWVSAPPITATRDTPQTAGTWPFRRPFPTGPGEPHQGPPSAHRLGTKRSTPLRKRLHHECKTYQVIDRNCNMQNNTASPFLCHWQQQRQRHNQLNILKYFSQPSSIPSFQKT